MLRPPKPSTLLVAAIPNAVFLALAVIGGGGWEAFSEHPARLAVFWLTIALIVVSLFSGVEPFRQGKREDKSNRWIFFPILVISVLLMWLPAYCDRTETWVIDGEIVRYLGLVVFVAGSTLRLAAVFVLGRRCTGLVAIQENHQLMTTGLYSRIRHPSYLGLLVGMAGWALVFRSVAGLVLVGMIVPILVARMRSEEALLLSEFGEEYAAYRHRTWRLVPLIY
jgi:protein-S-isoprenylcysteine O-methyltransferase Ste14